MASSQSERASLWLPSARTASRPTAKRQLWERSRRVLEKRGSHSTVLGPRPRARLRPFDHLLRLFGFGLAVTGLKSRGARNALDIRLRSLDLSYSDLPMEFDGYRILHLTDLHLDILPGLPEAILRQVRGLSPDLCVMTGDYRAGHNGSFEKILAPLSRIAGAISAKDGIYATLGNHDESGMAKEFEQLGLRVLANESTMISRGSAHLRVTGLDDVHEFYTPMADLALDDVTGEFAIALVHSPEMAKQAAAQAYSLYLCGHTHGGQICLPGGRPLFTNVVRHKALAVGLWRLGKMIGYTSSGAGVSGLPVRYFSRGEVTLVTLRRPRENSAERSWKQRTS